MSFEANNLELVKVLRNKTTVYQTITKVLENEFEIFKFHVDILP